MVLRTDCRLCWDSSVAVKEVSTSTYPENSALCSIFFSLLLSSWNKGQSLCLKDFKDTNPAGGVLLSFCSGGVRLLHTTASGTVQVRA